MISTSDFRNGTMFEMDGQLLQVVTVEHIKLARAGAVIKAKLRNLLTGAIFEQSFRSADKYKTVRIDKKEATYLYADGSHHYFMDPKTYDQVPIDESLLESVLPLLKEGSTAYLLRYQDRLIGVELPINVELEVDRQLDADQPVLVAEQVGRASLLQQGQDRFEERFVDRNLVIRLRVHEVVMGAVGVQVGRLLLVDPHRLVLVRAAEALLEDRAGEQVAQLGLDHGAGPRELDVLDGDDLQQLAVHLEHRPVAKIAGRNHCWTRYSIANS